VKLNFKLKILTTICLILFACTIPVSAEEQVQEQTNEQNMFWNRLSHAASFFKEIPQKIQERITPSQVSNQGENQPQEQNNDNSGNNALTGITGIKEKLMGIHIPLLSEGSETNAEYMNNLKAQYQFSSTPELISRYGSCQDVYSMAPRGITQVSITDNSGNVVESYIVEKKELGLEAREGVHSSPTQELTFSIGEVRAYDGSLGQIGSMAACKLEIQNQFQDRNSHGTTNGNGV